MLLDLLEKRRSVRQFSHVKVSDETINYILQAGRLSPSGGNEQSWLFGVVKDKKLIEEIASVSYNQKWIQSASFLIVLCTILVDAKKGGRDIQKKRFPDLAERIDLMDNDMYNALNQEEHQTKIAGSHMVLAALEKGLGSTWVSYFDVNKVSDILQLKASCIASEILVFGYAAEEKEGAKKKDLEALVFYNRMTDQK